MPIPVLIADDLEPNRRLLQAILAAEGHPLHEAKDGEEALSLLRTLPGPVVALVDWEMPGLAGIDVCRKVREEREKLPPRFLILVTVRDAREDILAGLASGANDYVTKPFDRGELLARVRIGAEMAELQHALSLRVAELQTAMAEIKQLNGLLPICSYCKKIRDDKNYWHQLERYIATRTDAQFSHGICPDCFTNVVEKELAALDTLATLEEKERNEGGGPPAP